MLVHIFHQTRYDARSEPYIGIDNEVICAAVFYSLLYRYVVSAAISVILMRQINHLQTLRYSLNELRLAGEHSGAELLELGEQRRHEVDGMVDDVYSVDRRCEKASQYRFYIKKMMLICYYGCSYHCQMTVSLIFIFALCYSGIVRFSFRWLTCRMSAGGSSCRT